MVLTPGAGFALRSTDDRPGLSQIIVFDKACLSLLRVIFRSRQDLESLGTQSSLADRIGRSICFHIRSRDHRGGCVDQYRTNYRLSLWAV